MASIVYTFFMVIIRNALFIGSDSHFKYVVWIINLLFSVDLLWMTLPWTDCRLIIWQTLRVWAECTLIKTRTSNNNIWEEGASCYRNVKVKYILPPAETFGKKQNKKKKDTRFIRFCIITICSGWEKRYYMLSIGEATFSIRHILYYILVAS